MDKHSAKYAEPIGAIKVDEEDAPGTVMFWIGAALAVAGVGLAAAAVFSITPATERMPVAQPQRPFESAQELRAMTRPVRPDQLPAVNLAERK